MEFFQYIPLAKAREIIASSVSVMTDAGEFVQLAEALGRVAAANIIAPESLPPFSRATVDGFAVRSADSFGASEAAPSLLNIVGEVVMGGRTAVTLRPGQAVTIPTGGMLPAGADAVLMLEFVDQLADGTLMVSKTVAPGENVIAEGEDVRAGEVILPAGLRIAPQHIGLLAACGCAAVPVRKRVTVAVISTGDELVDIDEPVSFGQIRDINSYALGAMLTEAGCIVERMGIVRDNYEQFKAVLSTAAATCRLVIISGGSSVGTRDYTVQAIEALGEPGVLIHGIAVKPGKPTIFGKIGSVPVFGLPGHPVAAMTVCELLVKPLVRLLNGQTETCAITGVPARLNRNVASAPGRDDFISVRLERQQGEYIAEPILGKSGLISLLAKADGIMHIPADKSGLHHGEQVEVALTKKAE